MRIGFVGLGTMGLPMAMNLLKSGYQMRVYNRTESRENLLVEAGAVRVRSPREAAEDADVVITMLSDSPVVEDMILRNDGVLRGCKVGAVIVDMSTISPSVAASIGSECARHGIAFLDAPVTGGEKGAIEGTLSIMVGGQEEALKQVRPVLDVLAAKVTYMGESGKGQAAKLCNQVVCGLNILAACEGIALAKAAGLELEKLLEAITGGAAGSWMLSNLAPKMVAEDWAPGFRIALQQKDLRLALEAAAENKLPLAGTGLVHQLFRSAEAQGSLDEGTQALVKVVETLGNLR